MKRYGKRDGNHKQIVRELRDILGSCAVFDTADMGGGFPDIVVGWQGATFLLEIKDPDRPPSKRKLTPDEESFFDCWPGHKAVILTTEEALEQIGFRRA